LAAATQPPVAEAANNEKELQAQRTRSRRTGDPTSPDSDSGISASDLKTNVGVRTLGRTAVVNGINRPLFHIDLTSALQSAVANVKAREAAEAEFEARGGEGIGEEP
jgi:sodium-independent sulfate anion transporter 11